MIDYICPLSPTRERPTRIKGERDRLAAQRSKTFSLILAFSRWEKGSMFYLPLPNLRPLMCQFRPFMLFRMSSSLKGQG